MLQNMASQFIEERAINLEAYVDYTARNLDQPIIIK